MPLITSPESPEIPQSSKSSRRSSIAGKSKRTHREVRFGSYVLGSTLGEGEFGKVKLGWRKDGKTPSQLLIKLIRRDSIPRGSERESKVHREINSLKRLAHPNIVRLEEVLQNDKYIGIVLEYASGGELFDYILEHRYLKDSMLCKLFAQLVSGVDYMHSKGIVHRDLKLENLLLDKHKNIIISDFGFVNSFRDGNELMKTSCGSPCYAAPELVVSSEPYELRKVDVWSCGVILYLMLAGYLPFDDDPQNPDGDNIARLYHYITHTPLTFPEYIQPMPRDLLRKIIVSNPKKRITLKELRSHSWLSAHAPFLSVTPQEWDRSYRSARSRLHSNIDNANRRHSLMEGNLNNYSSSSSASSSATPSAFLLNSSHARSYSTQNVSQKLYSHPLLPQTSSSHAVASMPVSLSSHEIGLASLATPHLPQTAATASHHTTSTTLSSSLNTTPIMLSVAVMGVSAGSSAASARQPSPVTSSSDSSMPSSHSRSHSTASILLQAVVQADATGSQKRTTMLPPAMVPRSHESSSNSSSARLPGPHVKPRPTSYHPGLYSGSGDIYSLLPFNLTSNNATTTTANSTANAAAVAATTQKTAQSPLTTSKPLSSASSVILESPQLSEKRNSWSKISAPLVDMSSANGLLSSSDSKSEKRKSVALDSLSNAYESLNELNEAARPTTATVASGVSVSATSANTTGATTTSANTTGPLEDVDLKTQEHNSGRSGNTNSVNTSNVTAGTKFSQSNDKENKENKENRESRESRERERENKENKENKPVQGNTSNRSKRFSFFYLSSSSLTNTAPHSAGSNSHSNSHSHSHSHSHSRSVSQSQTKSSHSSSNSSTTSMRKVLEPSNEVNIIKVSRLEELKKQHRMSMMALPPSSHGSATSTTRNKESSAAKKVVDFFKRRSMRV